jgi:hypothetical protein
MRTIIRGLAGLAASILLAGAVAVPIMAAPAHGDSHCTPQEVMTGHCVPEPPTIEECLATNKVLAAEVNRLHSAWVSATYRATQAEGDLAAYKELYESANEALTLASDQWVIWQTRTVDRDIIIERKNETIARLRAKLAQR